MDPNKETNIRPITIDGYDKDGIRCRWTGFDKQSGVFYGRPIEKPKKPQAPKPRRMGI